MKYYNVYPIKDITDTNYTGITEPNGFYERRMNDKQIISYLEKQVDKLKKENKNLKGELLRGALSISKPDSRGNMSIVENGQLSIVNSKVK